MYWICSLVSDKWRVHSVAYKNISVLLNTGFFVLLCLQGLQTCLVTLLSWYVLCFSSTYAYCTSWYLIWCFGFWNTGLATIQYSFRWFDRAAGSYIEVPFLGAISYLTLAVSPSCIAFAVLWAVFRRVSFAWIGQDILVRVQFLFLFWFLVYLPFSLHFPVDT